MGIKEDYVYRIWDNGGVPFMLTHPNSNASVSEAGNLIHGLILIGGPDLPVEYYGGSSYELNGEEPMHPNRVTFDREVFELCRDQQKPVLGICAGLQHINVIYGGTLYEDLHSQLSSSVNHGNYKGPITQHSVTIDRNSLLFDILGKDAIVVNSTHHQGKRTKGRDLKATAWSEDGLVEAVESRDSSARFVAVQWHPEKMENDPVQRKLFQWLIDEARVPAGG